MRLKQGHKVVSPDSACGSAGEGALRRAVWEVDAGPAATPIEQSSGFPRAGWLGRARDSALNRAGRACVLIGPAGVGKSRLAREVVERAAMGRIPCSESYAKREGALPRTSSHGSGPVPPLPARRCTSRRSGGSASSSSSRARCARLREPRHVRQIEVQRAGLAQLLPEQPRVAGVVLHPQDPDRGGCHGYSGGSFTIVNQKSSIDRTT